MHDLTAAPAAKSRPEIDRLFEDFGRPARSVLTPGPRSLVPVPAHEQVDDGKSYRLSAELRSHNEHDAGISVVDGVLGIPGGKKVEEKRKDDGFLLSGQRYGAFRHQIRLPADVDGIKARFKDGAQTDTLAKDEKATGRTPKIANEKA
jgi:HSP20 family protein